MKNLTMLLIYFWMAAVWAGPKFGGVDIGNGGDNLPPYHDTAWFLGENRLIHACIQRDHGFALSEAEAARAIQASFAQWISYIKSKGVYNRGFEFEAEEGDPTTAVLRFAENLELRSRCQGDEDLIFYLGTSNAKIRRAAKGYVDPSSFVLREKLDLKQGWSQGLIWVRNEGLGGWDWRTPKLFETVMLHEFGHLFGVGHVPDTVMSEVFLAETYARIEGEELYKYRKETLNVIDTVRELYACLNCDGTFIAQQGKSDPLTCHQVFSDRFNWDFTLHCRDSQGVVWTIVPSRDQDHVPVSSAIQIFKRAQLIGENLVKESVEALNGQIVYGTLTTAQGETHSVVMERNLNANSPALKINLVGGGRAIPLFDCEDALIR